MRRARRFSQRRLVRWMSVSFALVLSCFVAIQLANFGDNSMALAQGKSGSWNGNAKEGIPATAAPLHDHSARAFLRYVALQFDQKIAHSPLTLSL